MGDTLLEMKYHLMIILFLSLILSFVIANMITKLVMKPLNEINLESPSGNHTKYKEIQPFYNKIYDQKMAIAQSTEKLQQRESQFTAITGAIQEGLILVGRHNRVIFINPSAIKILHIEEDPLMKDYQILGNPDLCTIIQETILNGIQSATISVEPFTYQVETTPMVYDSKKNGVAVLIYDIPRLVNEEMRLRDFTANVSHELKTPLHVISGCAELLNSGLVKPEDQRGFITQIHDQAKRMTQLVTDIIELSRIEEGGENSELEDLDMMAVAKSVTDNLMAIAVERNIDLKTDLAEAWVTSSYTIIYELIFNLVDNAIKYTERGGHVTVTTKVTDKSAIVTVKDDGIGIAEEHLDRVFERFYRVDKSRSREVGGTGLGLAIVKHAAITSGGKVTIESQPGQGSLFTATFPKCRKK
ncbi:MAG: ATP-binding protein [Spirochaetales bacterium]|nr:ATP-binding protein [Candidatus Physcosoma equi]